MNTFRKILAVLNQIAEKLEAAANFICVCCLTVQTLLIGMLVVGRYFFGKVPAGTEELALLCMVWTALLSMVMNVRDDSHLKMELVDLFVPANKIKFFQLFSGIVTTVFAGYMVKYGWDIWKLRWGTTMASIKLSNAWYYAVIPLAGVLTCFVGVVFVLNTITKIIDEKANPTTDSAESGFAAKMAREVQEAQEEGN